MAFLAFFGECGKLGGKKMGEKIDKNQVIQAKSDDLTIKLLDILTKKVAQMKDTQQVALLGKLLSASPKIIVSSAKAEELGERYWNLAVEVGVAVDKASDKYGRKNSRGGGVRKNMAKKREK